MKHISRALAILEKTDTNDIEQACQDIFSLWKTLRKNTGKLRNMADDVRAERIEEILAAAKEGPAYSYLLKFRDIGKPATIEEIKEKEDVKFHRPHETLQRSAGIFKVQKEYMGRTLLRFLKEIDDWLVQIEV